MGGSVKGFLEPTRVFPNLQTNPEHGGSPDFRTSDLRDLDCPTLLGHKLVDLLILVNKPLFSGLLTITTGQPIRDLPSPPTH
jgi:hypothetical protein